MRRGKTKACRRRLRTVLYVNHAAHLAGQRSPDGPPGRRRSSSRLCAALYFGLAAPIKSNNLKAEGRRLDLYQSIVDNDVEETIGDLRDLLATGDGLTSNISNTGSPAELQRAVTRAVLVSKDNPDYDKVRFIDENGREVFRVNWKGAVVPSQSSSRTRPIAPFFQKANCLSIPARSTSRP